MVYATQKKMDYDELDLNFKSKFSRVVDIFKRMETALKTFDFPNFIFKPLQIRCLEAVLSGDVVAMLPTGYGKSLIYQMLPAYLDTKNKRNFVIIVCPLNSIIEDQLNVLEKWGFSAGVFKEVRREDCTKLFSKILAAEEDEADFFASKLVRAGEIDLLFTHPEGLLSNHGRELLRSVCFKENVVSVIIDEAHCIVTW